MKAMPCLVGAALLAAATLTGASSASAGSSATAEPSNVTHAAQSRDGRDRRVRIHNNTGWTMLRFFASDSRVSSWQEDMLGRSTLPTGRSVMMNIDDGSGACLYDFKAEFTNGQVLTRYRVNVCQIADYRYTR